MTVGGARKVTITAIAREAGVSVPTVSRVVNGRSDVSPTTRARIEGLLHQYGYRRRGSRRRESADLIDLVFNDLDSPWAVEIIRGVEDVAHAAAVGTVVSAIHRRSTPTRQWLENLRASLDTETSVARTPHRAETTLLTRFFGVDRPHSFMDDGEPLSAPWRGGRVIKGCAVHETPANGQPL